MVEPVAFGFNEETAANNYFQQRTVAAGKFINTLWKVFPNTAKKA